MKQRTVAFGGRRYAAGDAATFGIVMDYKPTSRRYASYSPRVRRERRHIGQGRTAAEVRYGRQRFEAE